MAIGTAVLLWLRSDATGNEGHVLLRLTLRGDTIGVPAMLRGAPAGVQALPGTTARGVFLGIEAGVEA